MSRILFLDDSTERIAEFAMDHKYTGDNIVFCVSADGCIHNLETMAPFHEVWLDHDLNGETFVDSERKDCGMEVVRWMVSHKPTVRDHVRIHSWNLIAAIKMEEELQRAGYTVIRNPFGIK